MPHPADMCCVRLCLCVCVCVCTMTDWLGMSMRCFVPALLLKGMTITEDKGFFVVKKIESSSILAHDQRIRVGDRILAINNKLLDGLSLPKAK